MVTTFSEPLANLTGHASLSRPQAVKKLWEHIKAENLQNPEDKREILCDSPMKAIFHADKINMFKMNKLLGRMSLVMSRECRPLTRPFFRALVRAWRGWEPMIC